MGCLNGRSVTCGNSNSSGVKRLKLIDANQIASYTESADQISAITLNASEFWSTYDFEVDTAGWDETKVEGKKQIFNQLIDFVWERLTNTDRTAIKELGACNCGIAAAVEDNNGVRWIVGDLDNPASAGLFLTGNAKTTGRNLESDTNQQTVSLTGKQSFQAKEYTGTWASLATS